MSIDKNTFDQLKKNLDEKQVTLVAVSKIKTVKEISAVYDYGQRDFGENYVQELTDKYDQLPKDIHWHFIGHLQSNKVKYIAPFVYLIHGIDSEKLLREVDKQGRKIGRVIDVLLQVHIATEETKFGMNEEELMRLEESLRVKTAMNVRVRGLMGMASFSDDEQQLRSEFRKLKTLFEKGKQRGMFSGEPVLSMGMSGDYSIAIEEGSNMVRIGSLIFGNR